MKKILLSCVTCLLALGLVTACEDEVEDATPEDPNAGVVEPGDNDGGSTEPGGSGDEEDFLPVLGTITAGDYFLGIEVSEVPYYFDGTIYSDYYGNVTEHGYEAVTITVTEVTGGYTLSFIDSDEATQYIAMSESGTHRNFVWSEETEYVWSYDTTFETFVALDSEGVYYYIGTYGTFKEMAMNEYSYLEEGASTYAQYPAHLYDVITYVAPTAITVTGAETVEVGQRITLTATATGEGNVDPRVTWSSSAETTATVSASGTVLGVAEGEVTIIATSILNSEVKGELMITVTEAITPVVTYKLGVLDSPDYTYRWFNGTAGSNYLNLSTDWDDAADVYIEAADTSVESETAVTISFYDENETLKYIAMTQSGNNYYTKIVDEAYTWVWDASNNALCAESSSGRFLGIQSMYDTVRAYANSNISSDTYLHVVPFLEKPSEVEKPELDATLEEVSNIESDGTYYLGAVSNDVYHLITGSISGYNLATTTVFEEAIKVTATGDGEAGWTLTLAEGDNSGKYIYFYAASNNYADLGLSNEETVPESGTKVFSWDSDVYTLYTTSEVIGSLGTYSYAYFEYYQGNVTSNRASSTGSSFGNAAHLYKLVED